LSYGSVFLGDECLEHAVCGCIVAADVKPHLTSWKEKSELARKLLTLLNAFTPPDIRSATFSMYCSTFCYYYYVHFIVFFYLIHFDHL